MVELLVARPADSLMPQDPFYSSDRWRNFRRAFLKDNPVCACGCGKVSKHVDHKKTRRSGGDPFARDNCQALSHSCHSAKTARRDGGFGNAPSTKGCDVSGWPLDPARNV